MELPRTEKVKDFWKEGRTGGAGREEEEEGQKMCQSCGAGCIWKENLLSVQK